MSRFFVAMFVGQQSPQRPHRRLQHGIAWPTAPTAQPARPSASYWEGRSQFHCAGAYTAAVGLVALSHGAGRTKGERLRASRERDARNQPHHTQTSRLADCPRGFESERRAGPRAARPFRLLVGMEVGMQSVSHCHKPRFLIAVGRV
jgi:hypothetical protein